MGASFDLRAVRPLRLASMSNTVQWMALARCAAAHAFQTCLTQRPKNGTADAKSATQFA
jgi:hypothetical protein